MYSFLSKIKSNPSKNALCHPIRYSIGTVRLDWVLFLAKDASRCWRWCGRSSHHVLEFIDDGCGSWIHRCCTGDMIDRKQLWMSCGPLAKIICVSNVSYCRVYILRALVCFGENIVGCWRWCRKRRYRRMDFIHVRRTIRTSGGCPGDTMNGKPNRMQSNPLSHTVAVLYVLKC